MTTKKKPSGQGWALYLDFGFYSKREARIASVVAMSTRC